MPKNILQIIRDPNIKTIQKKWNFMLRESRTFYKFWTFIRGKMHVSYYSAFIRKKPTAFFHI